MALAPLPSGATRAGDPWPDAAVAYRALASHVTVGSDEHGLRLAIEAYHRFRALRPDDVRGPYLYYVDLGLGPRAPRGYVFDMEALRLVEGPFPVAHGRGSSASRDDVPSVFSNASGSAASSLGLYVTEETYAFRGRSGGKAYSSIGLRLRGESGRFNDAAHARGIVVHGAPYVTPDGAGRSEGCPAMESDRAQRLLPLLAGGSIVFVYSPRDETWLTAGPWVRRSGEGGIDQRAVYPPSTTSSSPVTNFASSDAR